MLKVSINSLLSYFGKQSINPCIFFFRIMYFSWYSLILLFSPGFYMLFIFLICAIFGGSARIIIICVFFLIILYLDLRAFFFSFCSVFAASSFLNFLLLNHFLLFRFHVKLFHPVAVFLPLICLKLLHFTFLLLYLIDNLLLES